MNGFKKFIKQLYRKYKKLEKKAYKKAFLKGYHTRKSFDNTIDKYKNYMLIIPEIILNILVVLFGTLTLISSSLNIVFKLVLIIHLIIMFYGISKDRLNSLIKD